MSCGNEPPFMGVFDWSGIHIRPDGFIRTSFKDETTGKDITTYSFRRLVEIQGAIPQTSTFEPTGEPVLWFTVKTEEREAFETYLYSSNTTSNSSRYIIADAKAIIRNQEAPFALKAPETLLEKGCEVVIVEHLQTGENPMVLVRYKDQDDLFCTSTNNDVNEYKVGRNTSSLALPYSTNQQDDIIIDMVLTVTARCGNYSQVLAKGQGGDQEKGWINNDNLIRYYDFDKLTVDEITRLVLEKTSISTDLAESMNPGNSSCNLCVRNALYLIKSEPALFPETTTHRNYLDPYNNLKSIEVIGYITNPGMAINIKDDLDALVKPELIERFEPVNMTGTESLGEFFERIQDMADHGEIIIGAYRQNDGGGHSVMITPGGLIDLSTETDILSNSFSRIDRNITKVPGILECSNKLRENRAPICARMDYIGVTQRMTWFKYKK